MRPGQDFCYPNKSVEFRALGKENFRDSKTIINYDKVYYVDLETWNLCCNEPNTQITLVDKDVLIGKSSFVKEEFSSGGSEIYTKVELVDDKLCPLYEENGMIYNLGTNCEVYVERNIIDLTEFKIIFTSTDEKLEVEEKSVVKVMCFNNYYYVTVGKFETFNATKLVAEFWAEQIRKKINS